MVRVRLILLALIALAGVSLAGIIFTPGGTPYGEAGYLIAAVAVVLFIWTAGTASWRVLRRN